MTNEITRFDDPDPRESLPGYVDLHDLFKGPPHEEIWIATRLLPQGRMVALVGPAKSGKSLLALNCAAAIASGRPFLGEPTIQSTVLYIDEENIPKADIKPRLEKMGYQWEELEENLIYLSFPGLRDLNTKRGADTLMAHIRDHNIKVVIIDTISRVVAGKENDNDTWNDLHKHLERQLKREGISLLRLDHTGKDTDKGPRGGSAKLGDVDMTVLLTQVDDNELVLTVESSRMPVSWTKTALTISDIPRLDFTAKDVRKESSSEKIERLTKMLDDLGFGPMTVPETRTELKNLGEKASTDVVSKVAKARKKPLPKKAPTPRGWQWCASSYLDGSTLRKCGTHRV
jgi:hypothetical protein